MGGGGVGGEFTRPTSTGQRSQGQIQTTVLGDGSYTEVTPAEFTNALGRDSVSTRPSQIRVSRARYRRREKRCWSVGEGSARPFAPLATPGCPARAPSSTLPAETGVGEWTAEAGPCT